MKIKIILLILIITMVLTINFSSVNSNKIENEKKILLQEESNFKNYDSHLDIAIANPYENCITILYNNGSGGFPIRHDIKTNGGPYYLLAEDLNYDGIKDLAATIKTNNELGILFQNESIDYNILYTYTTGSSPSKIVKGFFNSDEYIDLAILNQDTSISFLYNNGNNSFKETIEFNVNFPIGLAAGDFNNDGFDDLAVTDPADNPWTDDIHLFINKKSKEPDFDHVLFDNLGQQIYGIASADYNNDGLTDLSYRDIGGFGGILVSLSNHSKPELFDRPKRFKPQTCNWFGMITDDFNNDGYLDIAISNIYHRPEVNNKNSVNILFGKGNGEFEDYKSFLMGTPKNPQFLGSGDINQDGFVDIIICSPEKTEGRNYFPGTVNILFGKENKSFKLDKNNIFIGKDLSGVALADFGEAVNENPYDFDFICPEFGEYNEDISFNFNCYDPEDDQVYFIIDWGDGSDLEQTDLCHGSINVFHRFKQRGEVTIKARVLDYNGGETKWVSHKIWIRKTIQDKTLFNDIFSNPLLLDFLRFIKG